MTLQARVIVQNGKPVTETNEVLEQAIEMRESGMMVKEIARAFGVSTPTVSSWLNGHSKPDGRAAIDGTHEERLDSLFKAIIRYKKSNQGNSPSIRWLVKNSMYKSTSAVNYALSDLEQAGRILRPLGKTARTIEVVGAKWVYEGER